MFGFISKKRLKEYMNKLKDENRVRFLGANYEKPISPKQQDKNIYAQGYEDGTDNFFNAVCAKFNIKEMAGEGK